MRKHSLIYINIRLAFKCIYVQVYTFLLLLTHIADHTHHVFLEKLPMDWC